MKETTFELLEWRDRRYQHVDYLKGTKDEAKRLQDALNEGYTGPRFVLRQVKASE